jgi:hypothetical protein
MPDKNSSGNISFRLRAGYDALGETYAAKRSLDGIELALLQRLVKGVGSAATCARRRRPHVLGDSGD